MDEVRAVVVRAVADALQHVERHVGELRRQPREELPHGPVGVKGSRSPHSTSTGTSASRGISAIGLGPGGPVTVDTNASRAPSVSAGPLMICVCVLILSESLERKKASSEIIGM